VSKSVSTCFILGFAEETKAHVVMGGFNYDKRGSGPSLLTGTGLGWDEKAEEWGQGEPCMPWRLPPFLAEFSVVSVGRRVRTLN
jgi:hypothetical protein